MEKKKTYENCPLALNIARTKDYLLPCSERFFFDWLVIQQIYKDFDKAFYKSKQQIEKDLGIKRRVTERIEKRFCAMGFLQITLHNNPKLQGSGKVTYYSVSFTQITKILNQIIDNKSEYYNLFNEWFSTLAKEQTKAIKASQKASKRSAFKGIKVETTNLYELLCNVYKERVEMYNQESQDKRCKLYANFPCSNEVLLMLQRLNERYNNETIKKAFLVFSDECLNGKRKGIKDHLKNFAFYNHQEDQFKVVDECLNTYICNYGSDK